MEKHRTLKRYGYDKGRKKDEPYKVSLENYNTAQTKDDLFLRLFDERDEKNAIITIVFESKDITNINSLHFNATETEGKWDIQFHSNVKFNRVILR